jgi:hypothetical protein
LNKVVGLLAPLVIASSFGFAQQTVFNVPSADVLDKRKVYGEIDVTYQHSSDSATFTPRVVIGLGHRIEAGLNADGFGAPGRQSFTPSPTIKWKIYADKRSGWSWLAGDDLFIPVQNRTYDAGDYVWSELAHSWEAGTRVTFGAFYITPNVVAVKQQVGGQFAVEQPLNKQVTVAADWFTGDSSIGYVTPGFVIKVTRRLTGYATYQLGNHHLIKGKNHQFLLELGWNFN